MGVVRGCLGWTSRLMAGLLTLIFIVTLPLSVIAFDLGRVVFSPEQMATLIGASFAEAGGFRRLAMEAIATGGEGGVAATGLDLTAALSFLAPLEREYLAERLLPRQWVEEQLRDSVADVYAWIDNDLARPDVRIDLRPIKDILRSGGAAELVEMVVDSWPPCTVEQMAEMAGSALGLVEGFPFCEPPEPLRTGVAAMAGEALTLSVYALPDSMSVSGVGPASPAEPEVLRFKEDVRTARTLSRWSWLFPPALLGLVMALAVRTWKGLAWWWGMPVVAGGLLTILASSASRAAVGALAAGIGTSPGMPPIFGDLLASAAQAWIGMAMKVVLTHGTVLTLAGAVIFAVGWLLGRRPGTPSVPGATPARSGASSRDDTLRFPKDDQKTPTGMFG